MSRRSRLLTGTGLSSSPLVSLPPGGSRVVYFPQGHSEQVAASMQKQTDFIPNYPNLPSKLICLLHSITLHADTETDDVYAQMTLQPVNKYDREALLASDMGLKINRQPTEFFCKTLTACDTSTHGGFSVPRHAAEKILPPLNFAMQPLARETVAKDLHDTTWIFRHIYRADVGYLGIRRANRQTPTLSSSVISSDSMHIGILAAAAHANANSSPFTIFFNPRASLSEFVVPLAKYNKELYSQVSLGWRFRKMFETEDCGVRRYMGTVTDPLALRLLHRLLAFDPKDHPTAEEPLADPYFYGLTNVDREPSTQPIPKLEFEFERRKIMKEDVRELIYKEILEYHPQMLQEYLRGGEQTSFMYPSGVDRFKRQFAHLEEHYGRVREALLFNNVTLLCLERES
ncbi:unnamed protein product [Eruca vesicaria subsp. sativa]|uniref:Auxin response factor domain-containing protein n=1 Tax=Eruca vesicaria subsp. sativa TaxID=29727 RepID=A0ABC8KG86_ERUVS|nr:unnamed protein product [Eruca vesicaria subsp. sativa]